jgi:hypothetical protein
VRSVHGDRKSDGVPPTDATTILAELGVGKTRRQFHDHGIFRRRGHHRGRSSNFQHQTVNYTREQAPIRMSCSPCIIVALSW